jgi:hypothetical protein
LGISEGSDDPSRARAAPAGRRLRDAGDKEVVRYQLRSRPTASSRSTARATSIRSTTPSGASLTDVAPADHKHHRGIFLAWFDMHGKKDADFWGWGQFAPVKDR